MPFSAASQARLLLDGPRQLFLLLPEQPGDRQIRLVHNFPGFSSLRLIYRYDDGLQHLHTISTQLAGYHKVWRLPPLPETTKSLEIVSFIFQYNGQDAERTIRCHADSSRCQLFSGDTELENDYRLYAFPLKSPEPLR